MLMTIRKRQLGTFQRLTQLDQGCTEGVPYPFSMCGRHLGCRRCRQGFRSWRGFGGAEQLLADPVCMLLQESVKNDRISVIVRRVQPLLRLLLWKCWARLLWSHQYQYHSTVQQ